MWGDINREPKRTNRFLILGQLPVFSIQDVTLPKADVGEAKVDFISHQFWYPGKVTWQDVTMTLVDAVDPNTSEVIMNIIREAGYEFPNAIASTDPGNPYVRSFSKRRFNDATGQIGIQNVDWDGNPIDQWILRNAWIKNISPGDMNMAEANILNIKLTFKYDWAEFTRL